MKIKLRDLTKEQYILWDCNKYYNNCDMCIFKNVICDKNFASPPLSEECWIYHRDLYSGKFLDQEVEIEENILDDKEKEYLEYILRPYRKKVNYIKKEDHFGTHQEFIVVIIEGAQSMIFPYFGQGKMYKNMELYRHYTPKDLGLWENNNG